VGAITGSKYPKNVLLAGLVVGLGAVVVGFAVWQGRTTGLLDLRIYLGAVRGWERGGSLYGFADPTFHKSATYPPFGLLPLAPLTSVPVRVAEVLWTLANLGALGVGVWLVTGPSYLGLTGARRRTVALAGVAVAIPTAAVWTDLNQGQVNLWLWLAILADVAALRRDRRWAGVGVGLATAAKLVPGVFIVFYLVLRRYGAAGRAIATAAAATVVGAVLAPADSRAFFTSLLWDSGRVGQLDEGQNNSLRALLAHTGLPGGAQVAAWLLLGAAIAVVGLRQGVKAWRAGRDLEAVLVIGCVGALISPITWTHHLVFLVAALALVVDRRPALLALWVLLVDPVGFGGWWVTSDLRALVMVAVVAGILHLDGRRSSGDGAGRPLASSPTQTVLRPSPWPEPPTVRG
jgi:alpha-1,2-mannosyltransferase